LFLKTKNGKRQICKNVKNAEKQLRNVKLYLQTKKARMLDVGRFRALLTEQYPLFSILIGVALISAVLGPFQNTDTQLEFSAASGVLRWGMPFMKYAGDMINQPPLGFYTEALVFKIFGSSINNGIALITAFGLGCTFLVYKIGKSLYGKPTGLFAAALFALTPWQLAFSRSFLIDVQCLFFSLLALFVGIYAIRKNSFKILLVSGTFFAIAFLTKFYAIYALIPLGLFYVYSWPKNLRRILTWVCAYFIPLAIFFFLWYQLISGQGLLAAFSHTDFNFFNSAVPSYFFVGNFLTNSVGWWFLVAAALSLVFSLMFRKRFSKILVFDLICLATIIIVGGG
jgi:4-amino-4-deoxy-L-arabinose transferase-like glycosyltransferase